MKQEFPDNWVYRVSPQTLQVIALCDALHGLTVALSAKKEA
jgi:hypothetical protein